jgi:hypothetical protein
MIIQDQSSQTSSVAPPETTLSPVEKMHQALILAEGGSYTSQETARLLRISEQSLEIRRTKNQIIGLPWQGEYLYPKWQIVSKFWIFHEVVPVLNQVLEALGDRSPWSKAAFMLDQGIRPEFSTPLAGLRSNQIDLVIAAAQSYGEHGAS